jgi:hypothetical protein
VHEILFIINGFVDIGFVMDNKPKYILRLKEGGVVGANQCTFNQLSLFNYRVHKSLKAYSIRKETWLSILNMPEYQEIATQVKASVKSEYECKIRNKIVIEHNRMFKSFKLKKCMMGLIDIGTK